VPAEASSLIPPALDQLREHPDVAPEEVPGLLGRLAQVPDSRDPRGVRHALLGVLVLAACAVLAGATSLLAVGEWISNAPPHALEHVGVRLDPLFPKRSLPAETTVRRPLARIDGDAIGPGGRPLTRRPPQPTRGPTARPCGRRQEPSRSGQGQWPQDPPAHNPGSHHRSGPGPAGRAGKTNEITCFQPLPETMAAWSGRSSPATPCTPNASTPTTSSAAKPTTS